MLLEAYFEYSFTLMHIYHWSLTDIENMMPWERDIYLIKLAEWVKEENRKTEEQNKKH